MKLEKNDTKLRSEDNEHLSNLIHDLSTDGRKSLILKAKKNAETTRTSNIKIPSSKNPEKMINAFEGYHLKAFIYNLLPAQDGTQKPSDKKNHTPRNKFLEDYSYSDKFLSDFPSTNGNIMAYDTVESLFDNLADYFQTSLFQVLLSFFQYCYDGHLPLRIFDNDRDSLGSAIKDMEQYKLIYPELEEEELESLRRQSEAKKRTKLHNDRLKYLISQPIVEGLESVDEGEITLNPLNHKSVELVEREEEIKRLDKFLAATDAFKMMFIIAPSGAGKTRLITQWYEENTNLSEWQSGFIEEKTDLEEWRRWGFEKIECDTLLIVDYIYRFKDIVRYISKKGAQHGSHYSSTDENDLDRKANTKPPKLRLILLDHTLPKNRDYYDLDANQKGATEPATWRAFQPEIIWLGKENEKRHALMMKKLIAQGAGRFACNKIRDEHLIDKAYQALCDMDKVDSNNQNDAGVKFANQPLFGILIGQTFKNSTSVNINRQLKNWKRRDLINFYFEEREHRLPWLTDEQLGIWVGVCVSAATVCQGISFEDLLKNIEDVTLGMPQYIWLGKRDSFKAICNHIISSQDPDVLFRYQPDIIGETFFLNFYQYIADEKNIVDAFIRLVSSQVVNKGELIEINNRVIEFVTRLVRNLANEPTDQKVKVYWKTLVSFLHSASKETNSSMRISLYIAITNSIQEFKSRKEYESSFLELITSELLDIISFEALENGFEKYFDFQLDESGNSKSVGWSCLLAIVVFLDMRLKFKKFDEKLSAKITGILNYYEANNLENKTRFHLASLADAPHLLRWMLGRDTIVNLEHPDKNGWTPFLTACHSGSASSSKLLLDIGVETNATIGNGWSALMLASENGHTDVIKELISLDTLNVNKKNEDGLTALMLACGNGHVEAATLLIEDGHASINEISNLGWSALKFACRDGHSSIISLLLGRKSTDVNLFGSNDSLSEPKYIFNKMFQSRSRKDRWTTHTDSNYTALMLACKNNHEAIVSQLLASGKVDVNKMTEDYSSALKIACEQGNQSIAALLLNNNCINVNLGSKNSSPKKSKPVVDVSQICLKFNEYYSTPLDLACINGHSEIVSLLISANNINVNATYALMNACKKGCVSCVSLLLQIVNIDLNKVGYLGETALILAVKGGHKEIVSRLLHTNKINVNSTMQNGWSALICACDAGHSSIVELLLKQHKINVNQVGKCGNTALMISTAKGFDVIVRMILSKDGVDIYRKNNLYVTALIMACRSGRYNIAKMLISADASGVNYPQFDGKTALMVACDFKRERIVKHLLKVDKVELEKFDSEGMTALTLSCQKQYESIVSLILARRDIDVNKVNKKGVSPLMIGCQNGNVAIVSQLLKFDGIDANMISNKGWNALMFACYHGHAHIVNLLLKHKGLNVNQANTYGWTALSLACFKGEDDIISQLLERSELDVDAANSQGMKPFMYAYRFCKKKNFKQLLSRTNESLKLKFVYWVKSLY